MDKKTATNNLQEFLEQNPDLKPAEGFLLSEPYEQTINNEQVYFFWWTELNGRNARGGYSYYVMPDGKVIMPRGGSAQPESLESIYSHWQNQ